MTSIESRHFSDDGNTPNNPRLPLVIMRSTDAKQAEDPAAWFEKKFTSHGWGSTWRWGIYPYHHYHSTNHEVLGVSRGHARLILGGNHGREFEVTAGDVILIPAGVGHKCGEASEDFEVVGAYPGGEEPDLIRSDESDAEDPRTRIEKVAIPSQDPVHGKNGPLFDYWK